MVHLDINTTDPTLLADLQAANIEGIRVSRRMEASSPEQQWFLIAVQVAVAAAPLLIQWFSKRFPQKTSYKTTINGSDVSNNSGQIQTIIYQQIHIHQQEISDSSANKEQS
jgi:hypothetical protein